MAHNEENRTIEIVVRLTLKEGADVQEVVSEMDYEFRHSDIEDTEIVDILDEF